MPNSLFATESYRELRKPLLEASGLPPACYTVAEFYQREVERIFRQHWQFVGREEQLPVVGSYICYDGPAGPVIIRLVNLRCTPLITGLLIRCSSADCLCLILCAETH